MENLTMTDNAISHIAKLVQVAILTGTDIVDNLRMAQFVTVDDQLEVSPDYQEAFNTNIERMLSEAAEMTTSTTEED